MVAIGTLSWLWDSVLRLNTLAGSVSLSGVVSGDTIGTTSGTFTFADKNAGTNKTVNVSGVTLTGTDAGNYSLSIPATALADIFQKALTGSVVANTTTDDAGPLTVPAETKASADGGSGSSDSSDGGAPV